MPTGSRRDRRQQQHRRRCVQPAVPPQNQPQAACHQRHQPPCSQRQWPRAIDRDSRTHGRQHDHQRLIASPRGPRSGMGGTSCPHRPHCPRQRPFSQSGRMFTSAATGKRSRCSTNAISPCPVTRGAAGYRPAAQTIPGAPRRPGTPRAARGRDGRIRKRYSATPGSCPASSAPFTSSPPAARSMPGDGHRPDRRPGHRGLRGRSRSSGTAISPSGSA